MAVFAICILILATIGAGFRHTNSWGLPELEKILRGNERHVASNLYPCLTLAYSVFTNDVDYKELTRTTKITRKLPLIQKDDLKATIPSPSNEPTWSAEELMNAAILIVDDIWSDEDVRAVARQNMPLTLSELEEALEIMTPATDEVNSTEHLIYINILNTLYTLMMESNNGEGDITKIETDSKVEVPMVDISIWTANEIHDLLKKPGTSFKLRSYLKEAITEPSHRLDDGEQFCVVTPVNVLPGRNDDYYIPKAARRLISRVKTSALTKLW